MLMTGDIMNMIYIEMVKIITKKPLNQNNMTLELIDNILDRLTDLPDYIQKESLENAAVIMENWEEISVELNSRAIDREYYELCAILRDIYESRR